MSFVLLERRGQIGILTINRPEALNALNRAVLAELAAALGTLAYTDLRCLIVTGAGGKAFAAGADIAEMQTFTPLEGRAFSLAGNAVMERLESLSIPTIAAVGGYALGGGCELALACDLRIASDRAVFSFPETSMGIMPGYGGIQRLVRTVGLAKTKELVFTCDKLSAEAARALGLVNAVVPAERLMDAAMEMAEKICANAPIGVRASKRVANAAVGLTLEESAELEAEAFGVCFGSSDQRQAMSAFLEKRTRPPFTGT